MRIFKNIAYFLLAMLLARSLGFVQTFFVAKALGPADFGVWVTLMLIVSYGPIGCLGAVETLLKEVPYYLGRNDPDHVRKIENGVMGAVMKAAIAVATLGRAGFT